MANWTVTEEDAMLREMMDAQHEFNATTATDWMTHPAHDHITAVLMECAEFIGHLGWEWWKKTNKEPDRGQLVLEVADIWCFGLSHMIKQYAARRNGKFDVSMFYGFNWLWNWDASFHSKCFNRGALACNAWIQDSAEVIIADCVTTRSFVLDNFRELMMSIGMDFLELFTVHTAKDALNHFRQHNGYKEGTYIKDWNGREDNASLYGICQRRMSLLAGSVPNRKALWRDIYDDLTRKYAIVSNAHL